MSNQGNQLEQQSTSISSLDEEYLAAQRAAYESILIGRETAQVVQQQGEQLHRAETIADETQYHLDRATRLLKGMTWSGWVNNMFTSLPQIPQQQSSSSSSPVHGSTTSDTNSGSRMPSLDKYDTIPDSYQHIVQAIKNYHVNVMILQYCETIEQKQTCIQVCNEMYNDAMQLLVQQQQPSSESTTQQQQQKSKSFEAYSIELKDDLELIRKQQIIFQSQVIITPKSSPSNTNHPIAVEQQKKDELFGRHQVASVNDNTQSQQQQQQQQKSPKKTIQEQKQDEHLEILASSLNELGVIAQSLKMGIHEQNDTIEQLDTKSDKIYESSKMVTRRTNRLIQNKSWTTVSNIKQSILFGTVMIRHVDSGKYLSIMGNDVYLVNRFNTISCTFDAYKRRGNNNSNNSTTSNQIGIKSHSNHKWLGQSFLTGSITCSSTTFGKREEWETDNSSTWTIPTTTVTTSATSKSTATESATSASSSDSNTNYVTRLLCVSANWGQGGYVHVKMNENYAIQIGNITLEDRKNAAQWSIILLQQ